jgi:hypothetical protein
VYGHSNDGVMSSGTLYWKGIVIPSEKFLSLNSEEFRV